MEITETNQKNKLFTHPLFITLIALLCCALWGSATPFIKVGYEVLLPPLTFVQFIFESNSSIIIPLFEK